ncbi:hypothetical protein D187_009801 [Cystobacter fuscus DSM 2262]|uniref:Uncharacterized protein n=1 Tax=Cystobacter fuscus (strain ATCC 25194 / DSM 2262 / NBRC 100088 / M29) TaxID=1242864 RepID=S9P5M7_CYSF2|nr:hypothetical protein [Cystobacter fuscus]EPX57527.1 hypothetical protein D187_009801 [Cystobacter fuscus DSM 2262]
MERGTLGPRCRVAAWATSPSASAFILERGPIPPGRRSDACSSPQGTRLPKMRLGQQEDGPVPARVRRAGRVDNVLVEREE